MYFSRRMARCNINVLQDTLAYTAGKKNKMIWFRPSVGETRPCTSVQHGATETATTYLNAFVWPAVVGRVCQCKISAKYGCTVTTAWVRVGQENWTKTTWKTLEEIIIRGRNSSAARAFGIFQLPTLLPLMACQIHGYSHG